MNGYPPQHPSAFPQPHPNSRYVNALATKAHHSSYIRPPSTQPASLSVRPPGYAAPSFQPFMTPAATNQPAICQCAHRHSPRHRDSTANAGASEPGGFRVSGIC
ncbi:hypothetical protein B0F90DRAFT_1709513 [Multifurca ochricompacta]|uniref:Uncharacterized protein n=1 Tax=Multifurca ochricompacta TaxID=376703 RepID=A0AAD4M7B5_9AGAM|nr:hypothetical protein B0F90DRAFT_1709513 [Multifurca ochricompacta]